MWLIKSINDNKVFYFVHGNVQNITVGRSSEVCDLALAGDSSISRKHAIFKFQDDLPIFEDCGSKFGSFVNSGIENKLPVDKGNPVSLASGDRIRFGVLNNLWRIKKIEFVTCISTLKGDQLTQLKNDLSHLGVVLKNSWDNNCTHLTMPTLILTSKVVMALLSSCHIVTPLFWKVCNESVKLNKTLPNEKDFLPVVSESTINQELISFTPNYLRKELFIDKKFIFFSRRQLNTFKDMLTEGGGSSALLSDCKMTKSKLCSDNVIVVQYCTDKVSQDTQSQVDQINSIVAYLKSKNRRVIPDTEISLAILYCSTEKYCNPKFHFTSEIMKVHCNDGKVDITEEGAQAGILAHETEDFTKPTPSEIGTLKSEKIINESCSSKESQQFFSDSKQNLTLSNTPQNKRKHLQLNVNKLTDMKPPKKAKTSVNSTVSESQNDGFDFIEVPELTSSTLNSHNKCKPKQKTLSFLKPQNHKKQDFNSDDDMFNFLPCPSSDEHPDKRQTEHSSKLQNIFSSNNKSKRQSLESGLPVAKKICTSSVNENSYYNSSKKKIKFINTNTPWRSCLMDQIKVESALETESLDNKLKDLDLKSAVVIVNNSLLMRTLSDNSEEKPLCPENVKNFKKFKKVLPLKSQSVIPKSAMLVYKTSTQVFNSLEEEFYSDRSDHEDEDMMISKNEFQKGRKR